MTSKLKKKKNLFLFYAIIQNCLFLPATYGDSNVYKNKQINKIYKL